jgi:acyl-CoA reductase-like NAD-dependent aldehyde dehydrogenase
MKLHITSPFTLQTIQEIDMNGASDVESALATALQCNLQNPRGLAPHLRMEILENLEIKMKERKEELAILAASEGGKPLLDSRVEIDRAINGVKLAGQYIGQLKGEQIPMGLTAASQNRMAFTLREPIGVVVAISAFNHPLNLIVHQVVTAVAAGCPVIVKPALTTPLSAIELVKMLHESGLPAEWCQILICEDVLSEKLATDQRVNYLTFIGSAKVGWYLRNKLAPGTRCALEHGGAAPVIIDQNVALEKVIPSVTKGGFYHAGQVCVSVQRVFVEYSIAMDFLQGLKKSAEKLRVGDPLDEKTEIGPLILPREVDRIESWVNEAIAEGGELITGGKRISDTCFEPTILFHPNPKSKVSTHEIFGPVVCVYAYQNSDKAIEMANQLEFHFQASVFTQNVDFAMKCTRELNATAVMVNDHTAFRVDWMPFGGRDSSGLGLGGIPYSMHEMTREKLIVFQSEEL